MAFSTRRGRPRTSGARPERDYGTPELQKKRQYGLTVEAIDLCLHRGIISPQQHWCGVHLRWLHALRYGVADAKTSSGLLHQSAGTSLQDEQWNNEREQEYHAATLALAEQHALHPTIRLCVYNERPIFLTLNNEALRALPRQQLQRYTSEVSLVRLGLSSLQRLWHNS